MEIRIKWLVIGLLVLTFFMFEFTSGGLVFCSEKGFRGGSTLSLPTDDQVGFFLSSKRKKQLVPFIGGFYTTALPSSLNINITDENDLYKAVQIQTLTAFYGDEKVGLLTDKVDVYQERAFRRCLDCNEKGHRPINFSIPDAVKQGEDVRLLVKGFYTKRNKKKEPFEYEISFSYKPHVHVHSYFYFEPAMTAFRKNN